jgi:hypothetical protein
MSRYLVIIEESATGYSISYWQLDRARGYAWER